ncbi:MAG: hypothetical protein FGM38_06005 [Solirubrobacterales bacterium]|nr:hypothetical protein [Solirubrobacterales bacterium]
MRKTASRKASVSSFPRLRWEGGPGSAFLATVVAVAGFFASSGLASAGEPSGRASQAGVTLPADPGNIDPAPRFGERVLKVGMTGPDVGVLRSMISSETLGLRSIGVTDIFDDATHSAVRLFQRREGLKASGVVTRRTADQLVASMPRSGASWYGAPLFGNNTACGQKFTPTIIGVAHKTLPCGTRVLIGYKGRFLLTKVIDRGPYTPGRTWDLSHAAMIALGYQGVDPVRHLVVGR